MHDNRLDLRMGLRNMYTALSRPTAIFGLQLWMVIGVAFGASLVLLLLLLIPLCNLTRRRPHSGHLKVHHQSPTPTAAHHPRAPDSTHIDVPNDAGHRLAVIPDKHHRTPPAASTSSMTASEESRGAGSSTRVSVGGVTPEMSHLGWGQWYTLRDLEAATGGLAEENVIGEDEYGVVYRGILPGNTVVAIKNLLNNRGQAEKEFRVEVEAIGRVRHKNLVRLLGYCTERSYRMLVYEYVDNDNLDHWLHGDVGEVSPLTWDIRMNIILGTAKGLAYLHEGLEPKVVHRDVKSSNILLDRRWNPKVSDFGLAKILHPQTSYVTTRVMGTFGYVAPEYASTGMLNESSDIYSFGVLIMEIISGRTPVDYARPLGEVNLVEWLKSMVGDRKAEDVVDPKLPEKPPPKALKRALLVALHCIDPDSQRRPKMGHVVHMLEMDDLLFRDDCKLGPEASGDRSSDMHSVRREASARVIIRQSGDEDANR